MYDKLHTCKRADGRVSGNTRLIEFVVVSGMSGYLMIIYDRMIQPAIARKTGLSLLLLMTSNRRGRRRSIRKKKEELKMDDDNEDDGDGEEEERCRGGRAREA